MAQENDTMNLEHHTEQMEAARRDFRKVWDTDIKRRAQDLGAKSARALRCIEHLAWHAFLAGLNIKPK